MFKLNLKNIKMYSIHPYATRQWYTMSCNYVAPEHSKLCSIWNIASNSVVFVAVRFAIVWLYSTQLRTIDVSTQRVFT